MRGKENKELNERIVKQWRTGRYKSYSALARMFRVYPKIVERAIKKAATKPDMAKALKIALENINSEDSLNGKT